MILMYRFSALPIRKVKAKRKRHHKAQMERSAMVIRAGRCGTSRHITFQVQQLFLYELRPAKLLLKCLHMIFPNYNLRFSFPLGLSLMTILLLFFGPLGPGLLVRRPLVNQPQGDLGCLLPLDLPRPPP